MHPRFQCYRRDDLVWWRLLGRNNRCLARSAQGFDDLGQALADAEQVARQAGHGSMELVSEQGTSWRWVLTVGGVARATSATSYPRRLECVRAVGRFTEAAGSASVSEQPLVTRHPGPRDRR